MAELGEVLGRAWLEREAPTATADTVVQAILELISAANADDFNRYGDHQQAFELVPLEYGDGQLVFRFGARVFRLQVIQVSDAEGEQLRRDSAAWMAQEGYA